jgi:hypothetical protein
MFIKAQCIISRYGISLSISQFFDKKCSRYIYNGILFRHKEKYNYAICGEMDETGDHHFT